MSKIRNFAILSLLLCSCATQKREVVLRKTNLQIPVLTLHTSNVEIKEVLFESCTQDICTMTKDNVNNLLHNISSLRAEYNYLKEQCLANQQYYTDVLEINK
jgi:hypothetical protein